MARALRILDGKHRARCAIFCPCPPCGRQGRPGKGTWQARIPEPRGSAPRERDHRGGDHPVPSRTRQLSPPSPRVLQREAAGGQGVALAEGAFLYACACPGRRVRRMRREGPAGGGFPLRASPRFGGRLKAPFRVPGLGRRRRMRDIRRSRCRGPARRGVPAGRSFVRALRACSVLRCMRSV